MQPTQIARPFHHEGWVYEEKVDGWRMLAYKIAGTVKLVGRNGLDHTRRFPGIVAALRKLDANGLILDGEVAVYDAHLVSQFEWLRHGSPPNLSTPPLFMVFDCLQARGKDLRARPLATRRNVLEDVLDEQEMLLPVRRLANDGLKAWQQVLEHGYEGLVAKDPQSPYVGGRTLIHAARVAELAPARDARCLDIPPMSPLGDSYSTPPGTSGGHCAA
jgi:bifunctional non-homologous end joining protein LigD